LNGRYTHSQFVEIGTDRPIYVHRKGSNVVYGKYFVNYDDKTLLSHYGGKVNLNIQKLKDEYARVSAMTIEEATKDSPLKLAKFEGNGTPQHYYDLDRDAAVDDVPAERAQGIIGAMDAQGRWLVKHANTSNPYIGDGVNKEQTTEFQSTNAGDKTDTSPYRDTSDQDYISTPVFIRNMGALIKFVKDHK
jgi:hypothetical protein